MCVRVAAQVTWWIIRWNAAWSSIMLYITEDGYNWQWHSLILLLPLTIPGSVIIPRACARGKWSSFVIISRQTWKFWDGVTSEHIRRFEDNLILLTCTCYWDDSLSLAAISAVFLLSGPLCHWPFLCTAMSHAHNIYATYIHAHAQQLTLHSGCGVYSIWQRWTNRAEVCAL